MLKIQAMDVNEALAGGLALMVRDGIDKGESRVGDVLRCPMPVITHTTNPDRRVLFSPSRNANPFFHLFESLWMLDGRNDLPWLTQFNKRMAEYSDDGGQTQPAAYGHRWLQHFGRNQIKFIVDQLRDDPNSRRAVIGMWDPFTDPGLANAGSKDIPCNTHVYFRVVRDHVDMTVCCRSNDLWWGAHGANAVHFSVLHEYVAAQLGKPLGQMYQLSNDYHLYIDVVPGDLVGLVQDCSQNNHYITGRAKPTTLWANPDAVGVFDVGLPTFMRHADRGLNPVDSLGQREKRPMPETGSFVLDDLAYPMLCAWDAQKAKQFEVALDWCDKIGYTAECDWRVAAKEWILRKRDRQVIGVRP